MREILFTYSWTTMIFENRNKAYGAFVLRKLYSKHLILAFFISHLFVVTIIVGSYFLQDLRTDLTEKSVLEPEIANQVIEVALNPFKGDKEKVKTIKAAVKDKKSRIKVVKDVKVVDQNVSLDSEPIDNNQENGILGSSTEGTGNQVYIPKIVNEVPVVLPDIYLAADTMPYFPNLQKYLASHIDYPRRAVLNNIEGKSLIQFVIDNRGIISQITIIKPLGYGCDEESVRVLSSMPPWKPGKVGNKVVKVKLTIPIFFKLKDRD